MLMLLHIFLTGPNDWVTFAQHLQNTNSQNDQYKKTLQYSKERNTELLWIKDQVQSVRIVNAFLYGFWCITDMYICFFKKLI